MYTPTKISLLIALQPTIVSRVPPEVDSQSILFDGVSANDKGIDEPGSGWDLNVEEWISERGIHTLLGDRIVSQHVPLQRKSI